MSCANSIIDPNNINESIIVGPHESSTRIDRDANFEVCSINFTCGVTTPTISTEEIIGVSSYFEELEVDKLCAPIGQPGECDPQPDDVFCEDGGLHLNNFSSQVDEDIGLPLQPETQIADGFQLIDNWLKTFIMSQPPEFCFVERASCNDVIKSSDYFYVHWDLPPRRCLGILPIEVPLINDIIIDLVKSENNTSGDFSDPSVIHITAPSNITTFQAFTSDIDEFGGTLTSGSLGTTWQQYTVESGVSYDIRVYGKNYNCEHEYNYLIQTELCTLDTGVPTEPLNLTCGNPGIETMDLDWDPPVDNNNLVDGNNDTPTIRNYEIFMETADSVRYQFGAGLLAHQGSNNPTSIDHPTTDATINELNPGTEYNFKVRARNVLNNNYGEYSNIATCTTELPDPPPELTTIDFYNIDNLTYNDATCGRGGYKLDGEIFHTYIYNYNDLIYGNIGDNSIRTKYLNDTHSNNELLINLEPGSANDDVANVRAYSGLSNDGTTDFNIITTTQPANTNLDGFDTPMSDKSGSYIGSDDITLLQVTYDDDYTSTPTDYTGFWKAWDGYGVAYDIGATSGATFRPSWERIYQIVLQQEYNEGTEITSLERQTNSLEFVIDDIDTLPCVENCGIYDFVGDGLEQISYVSGVPSIGTTATFKFRFTMNDIARKFLRCDKKHAEVGIYLDDNTSISDTLTIDFDEIGSSHKYFDAPGVTYAISTTYHNTNGLVLQEDPGDIQFNDFTISINPTSAETVCDDFTIQVTPFNLVGEGTGACVSDCGYLDENTGDSKLLRIDSCSTSCIATLDDPYNNIGQLISSGIDPAGDVVPAISNPYPIAYEQASLTGTEFETTINSPLTQENNLDIVGITYDHSLDLVTDLPYQLILLNGLWQNPPAVDYNDYFFPSGAIVPDMSGISTNGDYRYVTFKYQRTQAQFDPSNPTNPDPTKTQGKIRLTINNPSGLTIDLTDASGIRANHRLHIKVVGHGDRPGDGNPDGYDTYWLDAANAAASGVGIINGIVSQNDQNDGVYNIPGDGVRCLNNGTTTVTQRDCFIPIVTDHTAIFYVRIGWPNNVDYNFQCGIELEIIEGNFEAFV